VIIARLAAGLHCYEPERADAVWARLRHLGARRRELIAGATAEVNQIRDLLECAWPAVLGAAGVPFRSASWRAALAVALGRGAGDLAQVRALGPGRFEAAVRRELPRWGARRPCLRIVRAVFGALMDPAGVAAHRPGALERAHLALGDWHDTRARLGEVEAWMVAVLDDLGLTGLVTTIAGLTPAGAAAILAETGDLARFASSRSLVKHDGLCPCDNAFGGYQSKTPISGRGRPALRVAAWRAVWAALPNNPVMAARFTYLTTRQDNRLARQQAHTACAAACRAGSTWSSPAASPGIPPSRGKPRYARPHEHRAGLTQRQRRPGAAVKDPGGASPNVPPGTTSRKSMGSPARLLTELDSRCREQPACKLGRAQGDSGTPARLDTHRVTVLLPRSGRCLVSRADALVRGADPLWMQTHRQQRTAPQSRQAAAVTESRCTARF
jgi:transposase